MSGGTRLEVAALGSGSRGNAFLVESEDARVLVDAGFSGAELHRRLAALDVAPDELDAVVLTHEHRDHAAGAGVGARRWGWKLCMNRATARGCRPLLRGGEEVTALRGGEELRVGSLAVAPVRTCHDAADPVAVTVRHARTGLKVGLAIDLGRATVPVRAALRECAFLVLEANHDERLLRDGPYPWGVKQRIGGSRGHLSNRLAAELARELVHPRLAGILLAHLSVECNEPERALDRVAEGLMATRFRGMLDAAGQDEPTLRFDVERLLRERVDGPQLDLFAGERRT